MDREEEALTDFLRQKIQESLDDPRPDVTLEDAFARLERRHAKRVKVERAA